jgi:molybdenum cofactor cytidylyltransferase
MTSPTQPVAPETNGSRLAAIVLAAGYSSRMGNFKPLLPIAGRTAFEHCIHLFRSAGIRKVIAVLGHCVDELQPLAEQAGARPVLNPHFARGMFSSIAEGCRALPAWVEAAFLLPADIPLVRPATVRQLAAAWTARPAGIVYPVFDRRRGHPPLIAHNILAETLHHGVQGPLCSLLSRHESGAIDTPVVDEAIHLDMDTPADYDALVSLASHRDTPSPSECEELLTNRLLDPRVIRHSRKVAEVAHRLVVALRGTGLILNLDLVCAGALLHDLAKGQPDHAAVGASILHSMDFLRVAEIVASHTDLGDAICLDEKSIVYLADKLVRGEDLVTLSQRFQPALKRFKHDKPALRAAQRRLSVATDLAHAMETRLGAPLSEILSGDPTSLEPQLRDPIAPEIVEI